MSGCVIIAGDSPQPVIILGPLRKEIKNRLMQKHPHRFAECVHRELVMTE